MTQSIADMLATRDFSEPPEIKQIKEFVQAAIGITPSVSIKSDAYIVSVSSAAAAGALRGSVHRLQEELGDDKRVVIRIS